MRRAHLALKVIENLQPESKVNFVRDCKIKRFSVKVIPSEQIKYVVEVWRNGRSTRRTIGAFPLLNGGSARLKAIELIADIKSGLFDEKSKDINLSTLFSRYISSDRLKLRTIQDYKEAINFYLQDWLERLVKSITKDQVENRYFLIRDSGVHGGRPTYSQAAKTMRILSALMNYAIADDIIDYILISIDQIYDLFAARHRHTFDELR